MVKTTRPRAGGLRRAGDLVRAVLAGIALLGVLAAVPFGLIHFIGNPLPSRMPTLDSLNQGVGVSVIINVIAVVIWLAWAQFAVCVAVELKAAVSGIGLAVRVPAAGVSQELARKLVATMLLVSAGALTVGQASAAVPPQGMTRPVAAVAAVLPQAAPAASVQAADTAATAGSGHSVYVVKDRSSGHNDTLWSIAETHLGSGTRWKEIVELNRDRVQDDGGKITTEGLVRPGWTLLMPADAAGPDLITQGGAPAAQPRTGGGQHVVTVQEGDTLSAIAERELGDAGEFTELLNATRGLVQPDGSHVTDPNEIFPGQKIVIPVPAASRPAPVQTPAQAPDSPAPTAPTAATPPPTAQAPAPTPSTAPTTPAPQATPAPATTAPSATAPAAASPAPATSAPASQSPAPIQDSPTAAPAEAPTAAHADQAAVSNQQLLGIGALLGAGVLGAIAARRLFQFRRRRPGQTIAVPEEITQLEALLGRTAEPASAILLDTALRTLAENAAEELPALRAARVTAEAVELLVDDPELEPLAPFTAGPQGWWTLDAKAPLLEEQHARRVPAPYPCLVSLGRDEYGNQVLANLAYPQVLLLDGSPEEVREAARSIALDAATCPWSGDIDVLTAGFGKDLTPHLPKARARFVPTAHAGIVDLAGVLAEAHQAEQTGDALPLPWLMVCTDDPGEHAWELADLMSKARGQQVAIVLPASAEGVADYFSEAEILDASVREAQPCELADTEVVLQRVTDEAHQQLVDTFLVAAEPAKPAAGAWEFVPDPDAVPPRFGPASLPSPVEFADHPPVIGDGPLDDAALGDDVDDAGFGDAVEGEADPNAAADPVDLTKVAVPAVLNSRAPVPPSPDEPQIQVLGPVRIEQDGQPETSHGPRLAALAAYLYFRPGRDYGSIANAMDPASPWEPQTLQSRISQLRGLLGHASDGSPYLPRKSGDTYRLSEIHCDWTWFEYLAERGLPKGVAGLHDLEEALSLVRGRPFGGDSEHDWATADAQAMICRILDVAHTVACLRMRDDALDLEAARRAVAAGLEVQDDEILYRDWMRIEAASGSRQGLFRVIATAKDAAHSVDCDLEPETERLIQALMDGQRV